MNMTYYSAETQKEINKAYLDLHVDLDDRAVQLKAFEVLANLDYVALYLWSPLEFKTFQFHGWISLEEGFENWLQLMESYKNRNSRIHIRKDLKEVV